MVELRCPNCGHFLAEVVDYGRVICKDCGSQTTFESKQHRRATPRQPTIERATYYST